MVENRCVACCACCRGRESAAPGGRPPPGEEPKLEATPALMVPRGQKEREPPVAKSDELVGRREPPRDTAAGWPAASAEASASPLHTRGPPRGSEGPSGRTSCTSRTSKRSITCE